MATASGDSDARELVKLYYRIGEVSRIVGVAPHVLRYWETEFRTIRPQKSTRGQRVYSRRDVEKLLHVKDLLKNQGFTIAGARKRLRPANPLEERTAPTTRTSVAPRQPQPGEREVGALQRSGAGETQAEGKPLRKALIGVRAELLSWLDELVEPKTAGRPERDEQ